MTINTYNPFIALYFSLNKPKSTGNYKEPNDKEYYYVRFASITDNILLDSIPLKDDFYNISFMRTDSLATRACLTIDSVTDLFGKNVLNRDASSLLVSNSNKMIEISQKIKNKTILFIDPNQSNQRIIMQQGLFMFPYTLDEQEHLQIIHNNSSVVMIHKNLRTDLLHYLDTLGFNAFRLMPDLESICNAVKRKVIDERNEKKKKRKR